MLFIIASIALFAYNNVLWKKNIEKENISFLMSYRALFTSLISIVVLCVFVDLKTITTTDYIKIIIGSFFGVNGLFFMLSALKNVSLQWLGVYNMASILITTTYLIIEKNMNLSDSLLGCFIIILGFVFFLHSSVESVMKIRFRQHIMLLIMSISFTTSSIIHWENITSNIPPVLIISVQEFMVFLLGSTMVLWNKRTMKLRHAVKAYFLPITEMSVVIFFAILFSLLGLKSTDPFISSLLFLALPLLTIFMSSLFFKENIGLKNIIALTIISVGAFLLHYAKMLMPI